MLSQLPWLIAGCSVALLSALGVVLSRKPVYGAVSLLVHSLSLAALYLILSAEFVAVGQVVIYSGAIVVLFLFVVLLLPQGGRESAGQPQRALFAAAAAAALLIALTLASTRFSVSAAETAPTAGVREVGRSLFSGMLVPFELTTLPMLVAIVAAVTLWRRQEKERT
jgi:NADH-quinone oxidoreductase subunit J